VLKAYAPAAVGKDIIWYLQATYYFLLVVYSNRVSLMHHLRVISTSLYVTKSDVEQFFSLFTVVKITPCPTAADQ